MIPKSIIFQTDRNLTADEIFISCLRILHFFLKYLFCSFPLGVFDPLIWCSQNCLKSITGVHRYMLITLLIYVFSKLFLFQLLRENLVFNDLMLPKLSEIWHIRSYHCCIPIFYFCYEETILNDLKPRYLCVKKTVGGRGRGRGARTTYSS